MLQAVGVSATAQWKISGDLPANLNPVEKLAFALKYTALASAEILSPSWHCEMVGDVAELVVKENPLRESVDPEGREALIGCGVALQCLKLTLKRWGCLGQVELFPNMDHSGLVARIHVGHAGPRDALEGQLFAAIDRSVVLEAFSRPAAASEQIMEALASAAQPERGWLEFARTETSRKKMHELATRQPQFKVDEIRFRKGAAPGLQDNAPHSRRNEETFLFRGFSRWKKAQLIIKLRALSATVPPEPSAQAESFAGTFALLKSKTDDKHGWLASGQALARIILQSRLSSVSCALHPESIRSALVRSALRTESGRKGFPQAILRFGFESLPAAATPMDMDPFSVVAAVHDGVDCARI